MGRGTIGRRRWVNWLLRWGLRVRLRGRRLRVGLHGRALCLVVRLEPNAGAYRVAERGALVRERARGLWRGRWKIGEDFRAVAAAEEDDKDKNGAEEESGRAREEDRGPALSVDDGRFVWGNGDAARWNGLGRQTVNFDVKVFCVLWVDRDTARVGGDDVAYAGIGECARVRDGLEGRAAAEDAKLRSPRALRPGAWQGERQEQEKHEIL